ARGVADLALPMGARSRRTDGSGRLPLPARRHPDPAAWLHARPCRHPRSVCAIGGPGGRTSLHLEDGNGLARARRESTDL
ncbi:MAG: hypothetical protein AVDCRST_MAG59-1092, partial [uncultured Thermomicrobiales bacterium]